MKKPVLAYATAICMALIVGSACVVFVTSSMLAEVVATSLWTRMLYVGLPTVLLLGFSIAFARWHEGAAQVFIWLSVPMFYIPMLWIFILFAEAQAMTFAAMGTVSLLVLPRVASWTRRRR